jgi:hypothetical protein
MRLEDGEKFLDRARGMAESEYGYFGGELYANTSRCGGDFIG